MKLASDDRVLLLKIDSFDQKRLKWIELKKNYKKEDKVSRFLRILREYEYDKYQLNLYSR